LLNSVSSRSAVSAFYELWDGFQEQCKEPRRQLDELGRKFDKENEKLKAIYQTAKFQLERMGMDSSWDDRFDWDIVDADEKFCED